MWWFIVRDQTPDMFQVQRKNNNNSDLTMAVVVSELRYAAGDHGDGISGTTIDDGDISDMIGI